MSQSDHADDYVSNILAQDGLYIGLGLGVIIGSLLGAQNINLALNRAQEVLKAAEMLTENRHRPA